MSTVLKQVIDSTSSDATEKLAEQLGSRLKGSEVIELISDLGGGKTTFTRGLARGAGSKDRVASPTFTISKVYEAPKVTIYHFDFYRLPEAGLIAHELSDALDDPKAVIVVEWGGVVEHVLPEERMVIKLQRSGETNRKLEVTCPSNLSYLVEEL